MERNWCERRIEVIYTLRYTVHGCGGCMGAKRAGEVMMGENREGEI